MPSRRRDRGSRHARRRGRGRPAPSRRRTTSAARAPATAVRSSSPPRVEHVLEPVADQVEAHHAQRNRHPREEGDPPLARDDVLQPHVDHHAPLGLWHADAETDEREPGGLEDRVAGLERRLDEDRRPRVRQHVHEERAYPREAERLRGADRKSTRLNSSHEWISYAVFCLKKKKENETKVTITIKKKK